MIQHEKIWLVYSRLLSRLSKGASRGEGCELRYNRMFYPYFSLLGEREEEGGFSTSAELGPQVDRGLRFPALQRAPRTWC